MWTFVVFWTVVLVGLCWNYLRKRYSYWERRKVDAPKCPYVFGNFWEAVFLRKAVAEISTDVYNKYKGYNYVGFYKFLTPSILVRSPKLARDILVKDFQYFHDNDYDVHVKDDPLFFKNPFTEKGEKWKTARNNISPNYSSSKVKSMMPIFAENSKKLLEYLNERCDGNFVINAKDLASRITCENVAGCALGLDAGCFSEQDSEFMKMANWFSQPSFINSLKSLYVMICPPLIHCARFVKFFFFDEVITGFFKRISEECTEYRIVEGIQRNDFLDSLNDVRKKAKDEEIFGKIDVAAHLAGLFLDGFETSSIAISYVMYQLSANPEVQERLRHEVDEVIERHDGKMTYEAIQEMQYLDCVMKETLRINVPVSVFIKRCTQPYKLPTMLEDSSGPQPVLETGTPVIIPVHGLHNDEDLFPDPESFIPDRFLKDEDVVKGSFLPFGDGPRICLGSKFGVLQLKMATATIARNFVMTLNPKTQRPLKMVPIAYFMSNEGGLWFNVRKRSVSCGEY